LLNPWAAIIGTALNLATVVFPGVLIRLVRRRRGRTITSLLSLPPIAAVVLVSYQMMIAYVFENLRMGEFVVVLVVLLAQGSFIVAFFRQLGSSLIGERWVTFALTLGIPLALGLLSSWAARARLDSSLHFRWNDWDFLALATIYLSGFLIVTWRSLCTAGPVLLRVIRVSRLRARPPRHLQATSEALAP
jgi:hypothetical protein